MDDFQPITRVETYLAALSGEDVTPPEPTTRIEEWLDKVVDNVDNVQTEKVTTAVDAWLGDHVDPDTGYVLDDTLTLDNAAAPAGKVGEKLDEVKSQISEYDGAGLVASPIKWNQMFKSVRSSMTRGNITFTYSGNNIALSAGTAGSGCYDNITDDHTDLEGHTLLLRATGFTALSGVSIKDGYKGNSTILTSSGNVVYTVTYNHALIQINVANGTVIPEGYSLNVQWFDLTEMFDGNIPDNMDWDLFFTQDTYPYDSGTYKNIPWVDMVLNHQTVIERNRTWVVGATDSDFTTIAAAVAAASDGDTIFIRNGTYEEAVDARSKSLHFVGESRDKVLWTRATNDYYEPNVEISKGFVENLTFVGVDHSTGDTNGAYNCHIDFSYEENGALQFRNVRFFNYYAPCVGIGLRSNYRLSFVDCDFESTYGAPFYCHEQQDSNISGQYVELINCTLHKIGTGSAIMLQETPALTGNTATLRAQRCIAKNDNNNVDVVKAVQYGTQPGLDGDGYLGTNLWVLDPMSELNNVSILNYSEQT